MGTNGGKGDNVGLEEKLRENRITVKGLVWILLGLFILVALVAYMASGTGEYTGGFKGNTIREIYNNTSRKNDSLGETLGELLDTVIEGMEQDGYLKELDKKHLEGVLIPLVDKYTLSYTNEKVETGEELFIAVYYEIHTKGGEIANKGIVIKEGRAD